MVLHRNRGWLKQKYWEEQLSVQQVADLAGCHEDTVWKWMKELGIPRRSPAETRKIVWERDGCAEHYHDEEWLRQKYLGERLSLKEISEISSCSPQTILNSMKRLGIPRRPYSSRTKTPPTPSETWLRSKYWGEALSAREVGEILGCSLYIVLGWMKKFSIPRRSRSERLVVAWEKGRFDKRNLSGEGHKQLVAAAKKRWEQGSYNHIDHSELVRGDRNPNWRGGISAEGYPCGFNETFKEAIRQRDECMCAVCRMEGCQVHHIDYDKSNTTPENCITLCRSCHGATNFSRDYWQSIFQQMMQRRSKTRF